MFVINRTADAWKQVAGVIRRELPRLEATLVAVPAGDETMMSAFSFDDVRTAYIFDDEEQRRAYSEHYPDEICVGKPHKTPPLAPSSPFPLELLKMSSEMLTPSLKDCLRVARLARLNDLTQHGKSIVCAGGENGVIDTAIVVLPGLRSDHADARIIETLCAPYEN